MHAPTVNAPLARDVTSRRGRIDKREVRFYQVEQQIWKDAHFLIRTRDGFHGDSFISCFSAWKGCFTNPESRNGVLKPLLDAYDLFFYFKKYLGYT